MKNAGSWRPSAERNCEDHDEKRPNFGRARLTEGGQGHGHLTIECSELKRDGTLYNAAVIFQSG
jgi:hypothetical protein